ncbi:MAG TPA: C1 family peptidase [Terracidiphilus sp.]|nr:C1 family peptidase [Terracidiphilus sp.]
MPKAVEEPVVVAPRPFGYVGIPEVGLIVGTGWLPDRPDLRDYTDEHPVVLKMIEPLGIVKAKKAMKALPPAVDLRQWCSPVENQGSLGACTANAAVGVVEYYENRGFGKYIDGSRLFVYKTTRNLLGWAGDTGAFLRTTMGALAMFGVPPEPYWAYTDKQEPGINNDRYFDTEPTPFVYEMAQDFQSVSYFCHDPWQVTVPPANVLASVKTYLAYGIPAMFGFWGFPSSQNADVRGAFAFPAPGEQAVWGHAVVAVGYDDNIKITNLVSKHVTTGALLLRNSWGPAWGVNGYGYLPYDYVLAEYAQDFWSLLGMRWIDLERNQIKTHN